MVYAIVKMVKETAGPDILRVFRIKNGRKSKWNGPNISPPNFEGCIAKFQSKRRPALTPFPMNISSAILNSTTGNSGLW